MTRILLVDHGDAVTLEPLGEGPAEVGFLASPALALHRIPLFETRPRAMLAEARARAADLTAADPSALFVALGPREADGAAWAAFADPEVVARALDAAAAAGHDLRHLVPAPLALPVTGAAVRADHAGAAWVRDPAVAAVLEPVLADAILADAPVTPAHAVGAAVQATAPFALDLRQGPFRRRVRWWAQRIWQRRIGALAATALALAAAPAIVIAWRDAAALNAPTR
jgi:general secretion pathway protein L